MKIIKLKSEKDNIKGQIKEDLIKKKGDIHLDDYKNLTKDELLEIINEIYHENVKVNQSLATLEYMLMAIIRIFSLKIERIPLSEDDLKIKKSIDTIINMHEIANRGLSIEDWSEDYLSYLQEVTLNTINKRKEFKLLKKQLKEGKDEK